jgi:hypothetical protein
MKHSRDFFTQDELLALKSGVFVFDVESFANYFLVAFKHIDSGKYVYFESTTESFTLGDWLQWMLDSFCLVGFNSASYDVPIISMAIASYSVVDLKRATAELIERNVCPYDVAKANGFKIQQPNHIDLFDVAPLTASLKTYAARLHCHTIQDLPFHPDTVLSREQIATVREYCFNDLDNTELLLRELSPHLELRAALSAEFGKDLRSRSDAQLAQEIICLEIAKLSGKVPSRLSLEKLVGTTFQYKAPNYLRFVDPDLNKALAEICSADIEIGITGHVICPKSIEGRVFTIEQRNYAIGMGGLHSQETCQSVIATNNIRIIDRDVTGYYPNLILKNRFAPPAIGQAYLDALQNIVDKRYKAKKAGDKVTADSLKIASNGTFGKSSDPFSPLYSPSVTVQTTLTGQLSLLMIIEALALHKFEVISANTDGVVTLVDSNKYEKFCTIWKAWEQETKLETEETEYKAIYSRDVNNYIVVKTDNTVKQKGIYSEVGSALNSPLSKNPQTLVCIDAVIAHILHGTPLADTISACQKLERFVIVKKVTGGAQKDGRYLGKTVRWYYAKNVLGAILYCKSGNKVSMSDNGKPLMTMPLTFPNDINYDKYIEIATCMLEDIGFQKKRNSQLTLL